MPSAVTDLVDGGANALIGPIGSTDAIAAIPAIAGARSLACSRVGHGARPEQRRRRRPGLYRTALPDQYTVEFVVQQVLAQRDAVAPDAPWKVAIVARGDDYGISVGGGVTALLQAQGIDDDGDHLPAGADVARPTRPVPLPRPAPNTVVAVTYEEAPRLLDQLVSTAIPAPSIIGLDAMFVPNLAEQTFPGEPDQARRDDRASASPATAPSCVASTRCRAAR